MTNKEALKRTIGKILIVIAAATFVAGLLSSVMGAPIAKWLYFVSLIAGGAPVALQVRVTGFSRADRRMMAEAAFKRHVVRGVQFA